MNHIVETRRAGRRASEMMSLGGDSFSDSTIRELHQSEWVLARFKMAPSLARVVAEHAFAGGPQR